MVKFFASQKLFFLSVFQDKTIATSMWHENRRIAYIQARIYYKNKPMAYVVPLVSFSIH